MKGIRLLLLLASFIVTTKTSYCNPPKHTKSVDTLLVEDIDASDILLSFKFQYHESDTVKSNRLMREQVAFLRSMNLPINGVEEAKIHSNLYYDKLSDQYRSVLVRLKDHQYKTLYRQVCSQIIVKHLCAENNISQTNFSKPNNDLFYFLSEMKESGGLNVGLIYTSFLKFQYKNDKSSLCNNLMIFLPYAKMLVEDKEKEVLKMKPANQQDALPMDTFIYEDQKKRLSIDREYVSKLLILKSKTCL